jgi:hypothetical protein
MSQHFHLYVFDPKTRAEYEEILATHADARDRYRSLRRATDHPSWFRGAITPCGSDYGGSDDCTVPRCPGS